LIRFRLTATLFGIACLISSRDLLAQNSSSEYKTFDGGVSQVLQSIFIPPIPNAPFSLTVETEWSRPLGNGGSYTLVNRRQIKRDSAGHIYQERWILVPKGGKSQSTMNLIQVSYPEKHVYYNCWVANKQCTPVSYHPSTNSVYRPAMLTNATLPNGMGFEKHEELGSRSIAGVPTNGYRDTRTINAGVAGNDLPMVSTREFWYSSDLGINLLSIVDSAQTGKQVFTVTEINQSEPDPKFFSIPDGYTVVEPRDPGKPQQ
jgi:hypothetical protein